MSVTDAFRLLNSSIRGIRQDEQKHERDMMAIENKKFETEAKLNDPRERLARQQAAEQLEMTEVEGIPFSPTDKNMFQLATWENDVLPSMKDMMPEGMDLTLKGVPVYQGTDSRVRMPKWQAQELQAQIGMQFAMSGMKEKSINREISSLDNNLRELEGAKARQGELNDKQLMDKGKWSERRSTMIADRDDPSKFTKRLVSDNKAMYNYMDKLYRMRSINHKQIANVQKRIDSNVKALANNSATTKNLAAYSYTLIKGDKKYVKSVYGPKGGLMPPTMRLGAGESAGTYAQATITKAPGAKDKDSNLLESMRQDNIVQDAGKIRRQVFALENEEAQNQFIMDRISKGDGTKDTWEKYFETANPAIIKDLKEELAKLDRKYKGFNWYKDTNPMGIDKHNLRKK